MPAKSPEVESPSPLSKQRTLVQEPALCHTYRRRVGMQKRSSYVGLLGSGTHMHTLQHGEHRDGAVQELLRAPLPLPGDSALRQVPASP